MAHYEVAVVGGGFTGSLLAYVLASKGMRVVLLDARSHPRFAIGESSTPVADLLLEKIAHEYSLAPLRNLSRYGSWKQHHPDLVCGLKRGFSYFQHPQDVPFSETPGHERSLLVTASKDEARADTHWVRADVDHYFFRLAKAAGCSFVQGTVNHVERSEVGWRMGVQPADSEQRIALDCEFLVDASGGDHRLQAALGIHDRSHELLTDSCSTFGHFVGVRSWREWLEQHSAPTADHPFDCDHAAQHHLLDHGWMWMLRMDDGRTSVGWTRPCHAPQLGASDQVSDCQYAHPLGIARHPSLREIMRTARLVAPAQGLRTTARLQRFASRIVGPGFALMPTAAAVIDPLHSSGIAHGLSGVQRLSRILLSGGSPQSRATGLEHYQDHVCREIRLMDRLVAGCYDAMPWFELFTAHAMCYFVAAIRYEEALAAGDESQAVWCADDRQLCDVVNDSLTRIHAYACRGGPSPDELRQHTAWMREALAPWNKAGLLDPAAGNMYRYTAAPK